MYTLFLYEILVHRGFYFIVIHVCHSIPNEESTPWTYHNGHNTNNVKDCFLFLLDYIEDFITTFEIKLANMLNS